MLLIGKPGMAQVLVSHLWELQLTFASSETKRRPVFAGLVLVLLLAKLPVPIGANQGGTCSQSPVKVP